MANPAVALLLVDASQGVQAQTVANFYLAFSQGLQLVPVINKVDLPSADPQRALEQMQTTFELDPKKAVLVSAKDGSKCRSSFTHCCCKANTCPSWGPHRTSTAAPGGFVVRCVQGRDSPCSDIRRSG